MSQDFDLRCVVGPPGCGKTTHIAAIAGEAARRFGSEKVVIASLTRAAAHEVASRRVPIPREAVGTMHSLAYRALGRPGLVTEAVATEWNAQVPPNWHLTGVGGNFSALKAGDDHAGDGGEGKAGDRLLQRSTFFRSRLWRRPWPDYQVERFDESWAKWKREREVVDFQDMIDLALTETEAAPGNPSVIYLDEAQDSSTAEIALVRKWGKAAGRLVVVGDGDQSIYGWRGADPEAFLDLARPEHKRVLEHSYRVPRAIHAAAVSWIERLGRHGREPIAYRPRDEDGEVLRRPELRYDYPHKIVDLAEEDLARGRTVMILATCGFMLDKIRARLKEQAVPFHDPYRRTNGGWNPLRGTSARVLDYLAPCQATWGEHAAAWTWRRVWSWLEFVRASFLSDGAKAEVMRLAKTEATADRPIASTPVAALEALRSVFADGFEPWDGTPGRLREFLIPRRQRSMKYPIDVAEKRGGAALREEPRLVIGTIHSVKGAEAAVVYLIPDIPPSARGSWPTAAGETAVRRLFYVGMTRAREKLVILGNGPFGGVL
jgi:DNA helicase-2/ATP-dependent DNA helicase PcrA